MAFRLYGEVFQNRLIIGSAQYPSLEVLRECVQRSATEILTVSLRRESAAAQANGRFWDFIKDLNVKILPNTAGCHSAKEAVLTAQLARELFNTHWIKLEVIGNDDLLAPDPFGTLEAARILIADGFKVFPYINTDLIVCEKLREAGCEVIMPWGSYIGSGRGLEHLSGLRILRSRLKETTLIVDAGIGRPSHAVQAMELGYDGVLLNTAIAKAVEPQAMSEAFKLAVESGRRAYESGYIEAQERAFASSPTVGMPIWHDLELGNV
ncbi:MAG: thiazole synthase [Oligoflexales bacterium]